MRPRIDGARGSTVVKALASDARGPWYDPQIRNLHAPLASLAGMI